MTAPPNLSKDPKGFNSKMFPSDRTVRRGFRMLGYAVTPHRHKVPESTVRQFQLDYNKCADRFGRWGKVRLTGKLNKETLNALEHAIRWSKKRENRDGTPSAQSWQALCSNNSQACFGGDVGCGNQPRDRNYAATVPSSEPEETNFVEVQRDGTGKLRNIHTDNALRCSIVCFERQGDVVFATVAIPPQGDLPGGREEEISCPCVFAR